MTELSKAIKILNQDPILKKIISKTTLKQYSKSKNAFVSLVKSIVSQQLSIHAAASIYGRLSAMMEYSISKNRVLTTPHQDLRSVGLSNSKAMYIKNVALFFQEKKLTCHSNKRSGYLDSPNDDDVSFGQTRYLSYWRPRN